MCLILTLALMGVEIRHTLRALGEIKQNVRGIPGGEGATSTTKFHA